MYIGYLAVCRHIRVQALYTRYLGPVPVYGLYIGKYRAVHRQIQRYRPIYAIWAVHRQIQAKYRPAAPIGAAGLYLAYIRGYRPCSPYTCCIRAAGPRGKDQQHISIYAISRYAAGIWRHKVEDDIPNYREEQGYFRSYE